MDKRQADEFKREIQILSERITVLREQEKRYTDLSADISKKKEELIRLEQERERIAKNTQTQQTVALHGLKDSYNRNAGTKSR